LDLVLVLVDGLGLISGPKLVLLIHAFVNGDVSLNLLVEFGLLLDLTLLLL
jgi:hypothetical protein